MNGSATMIEIRKGDYVEVIPHKGNQFNELVSQRGVVIASYGCKMAVVDFGELVKDTYETAEAVNEMLLNTLQNYLDLKEQKRLT